MHPMRLKRLVKGLSLDELKLKTHIDQGKLSRIERGYIKPKTNEMKIIAKVLNSKIDEIFPKEEMEIGD